MLTLKVEDFAQAFVRTGHIYLPLMGSVHRVEFTSRNYERARKEYIEAHKFPTRKPVRQKVVSPASPQGKELGLTKAAMVDVYSEDDTEHTRAIGEWSAGLGRHLMAACLEIELTDREGNVLDEAGVIRVLEEHVADSQANEFLARVGELVTLETQDAADFFEIGSESDGGSAPQPSGGSST